MSEKSFVMRRDDLLHSVMDVLAPQLLDKPLTTEQFMQLHELLAQHDLETLATQVKV